MGKHKCEGCIHQDRRVGANGKWFMYCKRFNAGTYERRKAICDGKYHQKI